jgi:Fe-S-cluster containining protein
MEASAEKSGRSEAFGYTCRRCSLCCYHKKIQVNPYEVARLARKIGQTTTEFRNALTREGAGALLNQKEDGACVFLGSEGCMVYSDRPLVCRVYPLGRYMSADGVEWFTRAKRHPQSTGTISDKGTIAEYLDAQGAEPFLEAADDYYRWLCAAEGWLNADASHPQSMQSTENADLATDLIDMDRAIADHCAESGIEEPVDIEKRKHLHLAILYQHLTADEGECREKP